jgi:adenylylsulfate kinase-like enzyme
MRTVFITGKQGAGKSCAAKHAVESKTAERLDVEKVLLSGGETTRWELWEEMSESGRRGAIRDGIKNEYGHLVGTRSDLIVEGAILCNAWFLEPFIEELDNTLKLNPSSRHFVYLNASSAEIYANIVERAERDKGRRGELELFPNAASVHRYHEGFDRAILAGTRWKAYNTKETAVNAVRNILEAP